MGLSSVFVCLSSDIYLQTLFHLKYSGSLDLDSLKSCNLRANCLFAIKDIIHSAVKTVSDLISNTENRVEKATRRGAFSTQKYQLFFLKNIV